MRINSVKLKNIRSYEEAEVDIPEGVVLLSGDIGSGKSTILLAIEFALFGIMRGGLSGTSLLRHGKQKGSVELNMTVEGKDVTVRRTLKRGKEYVTQDSGHIITDGEKFEGTPVELKSKIIEMIGYPSELVSKSKSLIYRYTVYTPQEEMKTILFEGAEARLDTLRKIFNIDKYKRIKENTALLARELRSRRKLLESRMEDLDEIKERESEKKKRLEDIKKKEKQAQEELEKAEKEYGKAVKELESLEKDAEERNKVESDYKVRKGSLKSKTERLETLKSETAKLEEELEDAPEKPGKTMDTRKLEEELEKIEDTLAKVRSKEAKRQAQIDNAQKIIEEISSLDKCPVCMQEVDENHVAKVKEDQNGVIRECEEKLEKASKVKAQYKLKAGQLKEKLKEARELEKKAAASKERLERYEEKKQRLKKLEDEKEIIAEQTGKLKKQIEELDNKLEASKDVAVAIAKAKKHRENKNEAYSNLKAELTGLQKEKEAVEESLEELTNRMKDLQEDKKKLGKVRESLNWLDQYFVNVVDVMEKQVLLRIYNEFNEYFVEWFNLLMEDESINVRLDDTFSPVIIQDGYETELENLSGGEKTSVALAYRLSLNKVINDFIGTIKTKDLIILDEPTDGFSSEQLDKVREVLNQLGIKQIIIVSHEAKMETYVEHVVRIAKQNHVSRII